MTDPSDPPPPPPPPLGYRSGIEERRERPRVPLALQAFIGFVLAAGAMVLVGFFAGLLMGSGGGFAFVILVGVAMAAVAAQFHGSEKHWGWALGIWLGTGVAALVDGACYLTL